MNNNYEDKENRKRSIMLLMSFSFPSAIAICIFFELILEDHMRDYYFRSLAIFLMSCYLARYLYRRSKNVGAYIWYTTVDPKEWGPFDIPVDWLVSFVLLVIFLCAAF